MTEVEKIDNNKEEGRSLNFIEEIVKLKSFQMKSICMSQTAGIVLTDQSQKRRLYTGLRELLITLYLKGQRL